MFMKNIFEKISNFLLTNSNFYDILIIEIERTKVSKVFW